MQLSKYSPLSRSSETCRRLHFSRLTWFCFGPCDGHPKLFLPRLLNCSCSNCSIVPAATAQLFLQRLLNCSCSDCSIVAAATAQLIVCVSSEDCQARQIASGADSFVLGLGDVAVVSMPIGSTVSQRLGNHAWVPQCMVSQTAPCK